MNFRKSSFTPQPKKKEFSNSHTSSQVSVKAKLAEGSQIVMNPKEIYSTIQPKQESQNPIKIVDATVQDLIEQKYPNYQHQEATCVCGVCMCGKCTCKVQQKPKHYHRDLRTIYQQEYPWKESQNGQRKNPSQYETYKGDPYSLNKESLYRSEYQPYQVSATPEVPKREKAQISNNSPFYSLSQYKRDYLGFGAVRAIALKPFDQLTNPNQRDLPFMMDTTYRTDFKKLPSNQQSSQAGEQRYKLHINQKSPNLYMQTSYQNDFYKKQAERPSKVSQSTSNMPFGKGDATIYKTIYKEYFVPKEAKKCPARQTLEKICEKSHLEGGLSLEVPAIGQINQ